MVLKKLLKTLSVVLLLVMLLSTVVTVQAAPEILPETVESTAEGLVTLKAPEQLASSTTNKKLPISATAPQGSTVTVYRYNTTTGQYHKIWNGEAAMESVIGSTMLFAGQVDLDAGKNKFLIRGGWNEEIYTVTKFEVTVLNEGFMDRIKGVISVIFG